jgi:hypothetical protein
MVYRVGRNIQRPDDPAPVDASWEGSMITLLVAGLLLITVGVGGNAARADDGCCGASCQARGLFTYAHFVPTVTWYAPYPFWWPKYFGPPYSDYQVVHYVTPPATSALIVKERIFAINAANPALLPLPKEQLPPPRQTNPPSPR